MSPDPAPYPVLIIIVPLLTSFCLPVVGIWKKGASFPLALGALGFTLFAAAKILVQVVSSGPISYYLGGWPPPWGIAYHIDYLNSLVALLVAFLFFVSALSAKAGIEKEIPLKKVPFFALYLLLFTGLEGIVVTGDMFNLYVFLEVASLSAYAMIAAGQKEALFASFRYLIIGTVGACCYLLGVGYLYIVTGSLNMADLAGLIPSLAGSKAILVGFIFILTGLAIKMALFPLHFWLPDAYTLAPSAVSTTIAPIMTKVMAYVMIRVLFFVFQPGYALQALNIPLILAWAGIAAIIFGSLMALAQTDFKKMLSYVIVAEIGYIVGGVGMANPTALKGAVLHIVNDALMLAALFWVAASVTYCREGIEIDRFKGLFRKMPLTAMIFATGALAIIGVPPLCGFFSKWYLLLGGVEAGQWGFVAALLASSLINAALFFKVFDQGLYQTAEATGQGDPPPGMLISGGVLAAAIVLAGIFNQIIMTVLIQRVVPGGL